EERLGVPQRGEVVAQALALAEPGHPGEHLLDLVFWHSLVLDEKVDLAALEVDRGVRGQLERVVLDLDRPGEVRFELRESPLEAALAEEAPRAGDVGPDVDGERFG